MIVQLTRLVFFTGGALAGYWMTSLVDWSEQIGFPKYLVIILFIILGSSIGFILGGILGREATAAYERVEDRLRRLGTGELVLGTIGLVVGLLLALFLSYPLSMVSPHWISFLSIIMVFGLCAYGGTRVALIKRVEFEDMLAHRRSPVEAKAAPGGGRVKYLDTSAVIDGRFVELRRAGFLEGTLRVPRFVLVELQTLADSADDRKRQRGRRGLDLLATLREGDDAVEVFEADYPEIPDVDGKISRLTTDTNGALVTVDHNLSTVARVSGAVVLNLNELAVSLRPTFLPGDPLRVDVVKSGKEPDQGVGYLEDGTMIVVQAGREFIGRSVDSEVTSVLQTSAGRMIFARAKAAS